MKKEIVLITAFYTLLTGLNNEGMAATVEDSPDPKVKIALLLDTSNSMDGLINQAKAQLWDVVNEFTYARCGNDRQPGLEIALYQYGNDYLSAREGYIQQVLGFTNDLDKISKELFSLSTNGGEEFCGQVIKTSLRQLNWGNNPRDLKFIFIAGNEPFTQGKVNYRDAVTDAMEKDIVINTIFCGDYRQGVQTSWQDAARRTGGDYMAIDHNRSIVHVKTPYDDIIIRLNKRLNNTYVSYGSQGASRRAEQEVQDSNAMSVDQEVAVKRAVSKSSAYYSNSSWDLVDAAEADDFDPAALKKDQLPPELKGKSPQAISQFIASKKEERRAIQNEIREINAKRETYIKNQKKDGEKDLKNALLNSIRKQAEKKQFQWVN